MLHIPPSRSHTNSISAKANHSPTPRNVDAVVVSSGNRECRIALNLAKRGIDHVVQVKDYVPRHLPGVRHEGVRTLGRDISEIPLALRPLRPVALGELAALDTVDAAS